MVAKIYEPIVWLLFLMMMMMTSQLWAFPTGGPSFSCKNLLPGHSNGTQPDAPPYRVAVSRQTIEAGGRTRVSIESTTDFPFLGFICAVSDLADDKHDTVGTMFQSSAFQQPNLIKPITCARSTPDTAMTHASREEKWGVEFEWRAPPSAMDNQQYKLRCTVVQSFFRCWTGIQTILTIRSGNADTGPALNPGTGIGGSDVTPLRDNTRLPTQDTGFPRGSNDNTRLPTQDTGFPGGSNDNTRLPTQDTGFPGGSNDNTRLPTQDTGFPRGSNDNTRLPTQDTGFPGGSNDNGGNQDVPFPNSNNNNLPITNDNPFGTGIETNVNNANANTNPPTTRTRPGNNGPSPNSAFNTDGNTNQPTTRTRPGNNSVSPNGAQQTGGNSLLSPNNVRVALGNNNNNNNNPILPRRIPVPTRSVNQGRRPNQVQTPSRPPVPVLPVTRARAPASPQNPLLRRPGGIDTRLTERLPQRFPNSVSAQNGNQINANAILSDFERAVILELLSLGVDPLANVFQNRNTVINSNRGADNIGFRRNANNDFNSGQLSSSNAISPSRNLFASSDSNSRFQNAGLIRSDSDTLVFDPFSNSNSVSQNVRSNAVTRTPNSRGLFQTANTRRILNPQFSRIRRRNR